MRIRQHDVDHRSHRSTRAGCPWVIALPEAHTETLLSDGTRTSGLPSFSLSISIDGVGP
jgi:hypothetical protein